MLRRKVSHSTYSLFIHPSLCSPPLLLLLLYIIPSLHFSALSSLPSVFLACCFLSITHPPSSSPSLLPSGSDMQQTDGRRSDSVAYFHPLSSLYRSLRPSMDDIIIQGDEQQLV